MKYLLVDSASYWTGRGREPRQVHPIFFNAMEKNLREGIHNSLQNLQIGKTCLIFFLSLITRGGTPLIPELRGPAPKS